MKISAGDFETALRQRRQSTRGPSRPLKRIRRGEPARPVRAPAEAPAERKPAVEVAPKPTGAEAEEGEILAATEPVVVVLDGEEAPAAAEVPEAGQVTVATSPPAIAEPERREAPPPAGEGERTAGRARDGAKAVEKRRGEPGSSSRHQAQRPTRPRPEGPQTGQTRLVPQIGTMADAAQASRLLAGVRTAEFAEEMQGMGRSALLDMVMVAAVQTANGVLGLRDAISHSSDAMVKAMARADKYKKESSAQAESLARLRQELSAREESWGGRLKEAESRAEAEGGRASAAEAREKLAAEKLRAATAQSEELTRQLHCAEEETQRAVERAAAAEKAAAEAALETARVAACAGETKARTEEAEARAKEAEVRAQRAEAEAGRAVQDYKASPDFKQEVIEASLEAYIQGFEMCKIKVSAALGINLSELEDIRPGESDEEPAEPDEEPANKEQPGPSEP